MINRVVLVGRLTRDPELRKTNNGASVCSFTVAVDNRQKNPDGTRSTSYISCTAFQMTADNMFKFVRKGSLVGVEGRLNQRKYVRKDGTNASVVEVLCDSVQFLEPRDSDGKIPDEVTFDDEPAQESGSNDSVGSLDLPDDDLPF